MNPTKTFEVTVQYTRKIVAFDAEHALQAIHLIQKECLPNVGYKILDIHQADFLQEEDNNKIVRIGSGSINDQTEFNK